MLAMAVVSTPAPGWFWTKAISERNINLAAINRRIEVILFADISCAYQLSVTLKVILRHPFGTKPLLETTPNLPSVKGQDAINPRDGVLEVFYHVTCQPIFHHLWNRTAPERQHWRAAGHGLEHHEPEWLRPIDRKQERDAAPRNLLS